MAWDLEFRLPETRFFTDAERAQIATLFRAIQPRDAARGIPGADDCDAAEFLDRLLEMPVGGPVKLHEDLALWQASYRGWLAALDAAATALFGTPLARLGIEDTTSLLDQLERGELAGAGNAKNQKRLFDTLWRHCLQGCWSDPRWAGNRDRIMWRWLGYLGDAERLDLV
ncbi:gluconate 2-dehydrogenase subunit 3 family protein [Sphingomonas psychrotolerans]|uniref:Gluconate 2-dehydrogenase subunit 3 family protein n=1 Tax=Sphingomonas psychrotolerans TaxID=1327635 RepID=A0A2K8MGF4_9SPHN|nr:gluconate 2-dehydrogenase subunit 3 family protein [Sphingomonas psychrotolerans]ATY32947.1 hypothetical protein CVN68_14060 [Sphingomonas psychrotolerans]